MLIQVHIVNAFVDGDSGGNPAGVVLDADGLSADTKLSIARQVNLSETAFVSRSRTATLKVEFFTPTRQIPHCGHATVAAFSLCHLLGRLPDGLHTKESMDGTLQVRVSSGTVHLYQLPPSYQALEPGSPMRAQALSALGLKESALLAGADPCVARSGNAFLLVPVQDERVLRDLVPDHPLIEAVSDRLDLIGFYPFVLATRRTGRTAGARMFAPRYGIPEESATGTAAGPLGCYLSDVLGVRATTCVIEQGWYMNPPSPSVVTVSIETGSPEGRRVVKVGGAAARVAVKHIEA